MRTLISCKCHEDSQTVELLYTDGTLIDIDCMAVEDEIARNMYERSELDCLLTHDPVGYVDLILNGDVEAYLQNVTDYPHRAAAVRSTFSGTEFTLLYFGTIQISKNTCYNT